MVKTVGQGCEDEERVISHIPSGTRRDKLHVVPDVNDYPQLAVDWLTIGFHRRRFVQRREEEIGMNRVLVEDLFCKLWQSTRLGNSSDLDVVVARHVEK